MRVQARSTEQYPVLVLDEDEGQEGVVDIPDHLVEELRCAQRAEIRAEQAVIRHLRETGQKLPHGF